jgi:hypothetical protein
MSIPQSNPGDGGRSRTATLVSIRPDQLSVAVREARRKQKRNKRGITQKKELSARVEPHDWVVENTNPVQISGPENDNELPTTDNATTPKQKQLH